MPQVLNVLGMRLPFYNSPTLLLSIGLSVRVFWNLLRMKPDVIHVSCPGVIVFAAVLYSRLLGTPLVVSYHTHIPHYIPRYTWSGLVAPMWSIIRWCTRRADLTLVTSKIMKVCPDCRAAPTSPPGIARHCCIRRAEGGWRHRGQITVASPLKTPPSAQRGD